jgi:hypothetical protein
MYLLKLFQEWEKGGERMMKRVNSSVIYCKKFCKNQNVLPNTVIKKLIKKKRRVYAQTDLPP